MNKEIINKIMHSKKNLLQDTLSGNPVKKSEEEGGCGVVGFCCTEPVPGRHIYEPSKVMHNRGNGKGGGIAAVGFIPEQLGVTQEVLDEYTMLHIALLKTDIREEMEKRFITPNFDITKSEKIDTIDDWKTVPGLEVKPPDVWRYFVRVKGAVLDAFIKKNRFEKLDPREAEDEFMNQNSFKLNEAYYASLGEQKAFVLSHGSNIMILKVVGYAEAMVTYYKLEELRAYVWIAHQRFPTKGRVWHPGGAHPFAGINMALVHNGDFANYHSVSEHLLQRNIRPQFLTDTEVSALLFDMLHRTYHYPLEYIIEALAPTSELDFDRLPEEKQDVYRAIQAAHIHGSPDGPWFFIIARSNPEEKGFQLLGITDTAMLRPQVFSFSEGEVQVGIICSEKQAIDATLLSLSKEDNRICPVADKYWNARGGSHTDGGAFIFNIKKNSSNLYSMTCTDKFGVPVNMPKGDEPCDFKKPVASSLLQKTHVNFKYVSDHIAHWNYDVIHTVCRAISDMGKDPENTAGAIETLTLLNNRKYTTASKKRSHILHVIRREIDYLFDSLPHISEGQSHAYCRIDYETRKALRSPLPGEKTLVIDSREFQPEGDECDAGLVMDAFIKGWRRFICYRCYGQRFLGCGLGPETEDVTIDVYGSSGDYLGSGLDGLTINVHNNGQDQLGQIIKSGKMVVHGDVGQTFMYGAKGGYVYVAGNAAGRPLINSTGRPRVVINGTCLDFLAEAFMAGDPLNGGGFVVLNGVRIDDDGKLVPLPEPYPGSNLFSMASGGAIYVRDPHKYIVDQQLNGGRFAPLTEKDWDLILPLLEENEKLFGIKISDLLTVDNQQRRHSEVYRKVIPAPTGALASGKVRIPEDDVVLEEEAISE